MKINFSVAADYIRFCGLIRPAVPPDSITVNPATLSVVVNRSCIEVAHVCLANFSKGNYRCHFVCVAA